MLESVDPEVAQNPIVRSEDLFQRALRDLSFEVQIPRTKLEELSKIGPTSPTLADERRRVRFRKLKRAIICCDRTLPSIERTRQLSLGLMLNISKEGIGMLYHLQLYPQERFVMRIVGYDLLRLTVVRCRKLGPKCYEIGATSDVPIDVEQFFTT